MIASPKPTWSAEAVVRAVWTRVAAAPEALAERIEAFTQMMRDRLGISVWQVSSPQNRDTMTPWPRTPEERATVVAQQRSTAGFADPTGWTGYSYWLDGFTQRVIIRPMVHAGRDGPGQAWSEQLGDCAPLRGRRLGHTTRRQ
jgi:hypothetical protein